MKYYTYLGRHFRQKPERDAMRVMPHESDCLELRNKEVLGRNQRSSRLINEELLINPKCP